MSISELHAILGALAAALAERPELAPLLALYRDLYSLQWAVGARLPQRPAPDPSVAFQRAEAGLPQLCFDELCLDAASFSDLVTGVLRVLAHHNGDQEPPENAGPGLTILRRARYIFESWPMLTVPDEADRVSAPDDTGSGPLQDQAIALALAPHLQHAAEAVQPILWKVHWGRPVCPACGGQPNLALLDSVRGARKLVCARCDTQWDYTRVGCPYCRSQEKQTYFLGEGGFYRLYVCPACNRYLKTVDLREISRPVVPVIERLLSVHMDLAAKHKGYAG